MSGGFPFITYIISPIGVLCSFGALAGLLAALLIWRRRSPIVIICTVLVSLVLLFQLSILFWLANTWGRNAPKDMPTPIPDTSTPDPHHDGHPPKNGGLF